MGSEREELERFVAARWPVLVRTAALVTGDRVRAERAVTLALVRLVGRWTRVVEDGDPAGWVRRELVRRLVADERRPRPEPTGQGSSRTVDDESVETSILRGYAALPPLARVAIALEHVEGLGPVEVAAATRQGPARVTADTSTARAELDRARDAAFRRLGLDPSRTAPQADLRSALESLAARAEPSADPIDIVRRHRARRLHRGIGAVAAVLALLAGAVALQTGLLPGGGDAQGGATAGPGSDVTSTLWTDLTTWPARGELVNDVTTHELVTVRWAPTTRLVFAGDVGSARMVVGIEPASATSPPFVDVVAGRAGTSVVWGPMDRYPLTHPGDALVLTGPPAGGRTPLLVLAPPTTTYAETSAHVHYGADGSVTRSWSPADLTRGVARLELAGTSLPALRVQVGGYDGPPDNADETLTPRTDPCPSCTGGAWVSIKSLTVARIVAAAVGIPVDQVRTTVLGDGLVRTPVFPALPAPRTVTRTEIVCIDYRLPGGVLLRTVDLRGFADTVARSSWESAGLIPSATAGTRPCVAVGSTWPDGDVRYAVLAPGASTLQVSSLGPSGAGHLGPKVAVRNGIAVVSAAQSVQAGQAELRAFDAHGHLLESWDLATLVTRRDPLDLGPGASG